MIAQDVEKILPELVSAVHVPQKQDENSNTIAPALNLKALNYQAFIPILIAGMQEQQKKLDSVKNVNESQQDLIDDLLSRVSALEGQGSRKINPQDSTNNDNNNKFLQFVELSNENAIVLNQNDPNPFAEETNITFFLPETIGSAKILFYDKLGKIIKSVEILSRGSGQLHVYASNLSSGIYMYSLIADNKVVDSKKMMCNK